MWAVNDWGKWQCCNLLLGAAMLRQYLHLCLGAAHKWERDKLGLALDEESGTEYISVTLAS